MKAKNLHRATPMRSDITIAIRDDRQRGPVRAPRIRGGSRRLARPAAGKPMKIAPKPLCGALSMELELPAPPKVGMVSLGCPKNLVDSERILTKLRSDGYAMSPDYAGADVVLVNTCGFLDSRQGGEPRGDRRGDRRERPGRSSPAASARRPR